MRLRRTPIIVSAVVSVGLVLLALTMYNRRAWQPGQGLRQAWAKKGVERPNVVLITLDTTRADHLGCYGDTGARTPAFDELAQSGVLFSQAASPAPLTLPSHCSIMTGLYPTYHGVRLNGTTALSQGQMTLAEVLSAQGYQTGAFIGAFVLDGRWGLNQGFLVYDDQFDMRKFKHLDLAGVQRPANEVMDAALHWLGGHKDGPFFAWIHLYDPHTPYDPPEPFRSQFGSRGPAGLYDGEIAFADQQVGGACPGSGAPAWISGRSSSSSAITARDSGAMAKAPTASSSTITPFAFRWSSRRRSTNCAASTSMRRSASSMCSRPSSRWPASTRRPGSTGGRSCR
jgi:hypothetical protein